MDFTVKKAHLIAAIDKCAEAADPKAHNLAFRVMRVEARSKNLLCSAVGEQSSIKAACFADTIKEPGFFHVIPARLRDIASSMPDGLIRFTIKGSRVTAKSTSSARKAAFESPIVDARLIDSPGKDAAWETMECEELVRVVKTAKYSSIPEQDDTVPAMLLIPTERGMDVFACNGYIITLAESSIRMTGDQPIQLPLAAVSMLSLMIADEKSVRVFQDESRLYLANNSTSASIRLTEYRLRGVFQNFIALFKAPENERGPAFKLARLVESAKSVLATGGFASSTERGTRGYQLRLKLDAAAVTVSLALSEAEAEDEFDTTQPGAELRFKVSSQFLLRMLESMGGADEVQSLSANNSNMLVLRSQGIMAGVMREGGD